jgi:hypothetical protein
MKYIVLNDLIEGAVITGLEKVVLDEAHKSYATATFVS